MSARRTPQRWQPPSMAVVLLACVAWWLTERLDAWRPFE